VNNDEGILLPGMTAYVSVVTARLKHVLKVPNAALRFRPAADTLIEKALEDETAGSAESKSGTTAPEASLTGMRGKVYLLGKKGLRPVRLQIGASDNETTEVLSGAIKAGDPVVVDVGGAGSTSKRSPSLRIR